MTRTIGDVLLETLELINLKPEPICWRCKLSRVPVKGTLCDFCIETIIEGED